MTRPTLTLKRKTPDTATEGQAESSTDTKPKGWTYPTKGKTVIIPEQQTKPTPAAKPQKPQKPQPKNAKTPKQPKPPKVKLPPEPPKPDRSGEILAALVSMYPLAFALPAQNPLEIGTIQKIPNIDGYSRRELRDTLTKYCNDDAYLNCIVNGTHRITLDGATGSEITQDQKTNAKAMLGGSLKKISLKHGKPKKKRKQPVVTSTEN